MSVSECIAAIEEANAGRLDDEAVELIVEQIQRAREGREKLDGLDRDLFNAAEQLASDADIAARIEKRNRIINVIKDAELTRLAREADNATDDPSMGLEAAMVGVNAPFFGSRASVDAKSKAILSQHMGGMIADLKKEGLLPVFNGRALDREISAELWDLSLKRPTGNATTSKQAKAIAKVVDKYRKAAIERENRAGAYIRYRTGYVARQSHDRTRIRRAGFPAWREAVRGKIDWDAMRVPQKGRPKYLQDVYDNLATGVRGIDDFDESEIDFSFKGPGNLAKKESAHRVILFKSSNDWFDYNQTFGRASLNEAILGDLSRSARATALMDTFGTNPRAMFDRMRDKLKQDHKSDAPKVDRLNRMSLDWNFAEIDGSVNTAQHHGWAAFGRGVRAVQSMASLGGAAISSITDIAMSASERKWQGRSITGAWLDAFNAPFRGLTSKGDERQMAEMIGVGIDGMMGDFVSRFAAQDDVPGRMSKLMSAYFKLNLLGPWTDSVKRGIGLMMSNDLAAKAAGDWASLDMRTRTHLAQYGFDADAWEMARTAVRTDGEGRRYMVPDGLPEATDRAGRRERDRVSQMLGAYITDRVDFASPTPGARERSLLRMGFQPGTPQGEAMRFMMQFKAFPITVSQKTLGRDIYGGGAKSLRDAIMKGEGDITSLVSIMVGGTILGYFALQAKEMAKGRQPRDPQDKEGISKLIVASMMQGGGAGIYGDFLFGEANRFGGGLLGTIAGPTAGDLEDFTQIMWKLRDTTFAGEPPDVGAELTRFVSSNTPFLNLFYTKAAMDYLFLYQLQEATNPGYLRRMERRMKRENNQEFFLPPSQAVR